MENELIKGKEAISISSNKLIKLAQCYKEVFNYAWQEEWTIDSALEELKRGLAISEKRLPLLSFIKQDNEIHGFALAILSSVDEICCDDMPFNLCKQKKEEGVKVVKYWCQLANHDKVLIFRELGVKKEYQIWQGTHMGSILNLQIARAAKNAGYKVLIYWTDASKTNVFIQCLGLCWHPIHFFVDEQRVIMKGDVDSLIEYSQGFINKDRIIFRRMSENKKVYLCDN